MAEPIVTLNARPEEIDEITEPAYPPYARLRQLVEPGTQVLDVGCGNGKIGAYLRSAGAVVDGIEPSDVRIDVARARLHYVSDQWAGPGFDDPNIQAEYDLITFLDVIEHIPDPQPVIQWAADRLAPGGRICALIPNSAHWSFRLKMLRGDWEYDAHGGLFDRTHVRFFNPETASRLRPEGLVEVGRSYSGFGRGSSPRLVKLRPRMFAIHTFFEWQRQP
jgi:SAM-dependent methyltransferase